MLKWLSHWWQEKHIVASLKLQDMYQKPESTFIRGVYDDFRPKPQGLHICCFEYNSW